MNLTTFALVACSSSAREPTSGNATNAFKVYGVGWTGEVRVSTSSEALHVDACVNDQRCGSRVVLIAGMAPMSRWQVYEPAAAPEGAPHADELEPPAAGTCRLVYEWVDEIGTTACATIHDSNTHAVELQFMLDLSLFADELQTGDVASVIVTDEGDGRVLAERTEVIEAPAPYYEFFDLPAVTPDS